MLNMILFPSDFFNTREADEDYQQEMDAAKAAGGFDTALFGYDKWFNEGKLTVFGAPKEEQLAIYRGWMMRPEQYGRFYELLLEKNIRLVTEPEQYQRLHLFPNIYEAVKDDTARMEVYPLHERIDVEQLKRSFQRFMVKDYVKSLKGPEFPRFFDQHVTQGEFDRYMALFYQYRGDLLTGGICIKEYLDLKRYGEKTNEYRVFYMDHTAATVCRNSEQGEDAPEPPQSLIEKYKDLDSPYYTIDYAELEDGSWKILETGDGGVSGLPDEQDVEEYYRILRERFNHGKIL